MVDSGGVGRRGFTIVGRSIVGSTHAGIGRARASFWLASLRGSAGARPWRPGEWMGGEFLGSYSVSCWYGPAPMALLIQFCGVIWRSQASRARRQPR